ncbi:MAG: right-handed parallel beta-helix repeat-containing protein [Candidatus Firestonebacteria bacterium]|nr:right-handed parallel beta-helix repeat-containing protein [Candidatus Firestonebacteria bacterium]
MKIKIIFIIILIIVSACSYKRHLIQHVSKINNAFITSNTTWQGTIEIEGSVIIMKGVILTILPGTHIKFIPEQIERNSSDPHDLTNGIVVEGRIKALGTPESVIVFTSAAKKPKPGDWGKILLKYSRDNIFKYCKFEYSEFAIHAHFSTGEITDSIFTYNVEGLRLGMSSFIIRYNNFVNNISRGINFRSSINTIEFNNINNNETGIFLYEKNSESNISNNNIFNNTKYNLQLGEFYNEDIKLGKNWWGVFENKDVYKYIYDKEDNPQLGKVYLEPSLTIIERAGIRN